MINFDTVALSKISVTSMDSNATQRNNNICVVGATGSGKSLSIIHPRLLRTFNTNLVVFDPKRELVDLYRGVFEGRGYNVKELNLSNPLESEICFDPLEYVASEQDINVLAQGLINLTPQNDFTTADAYWNYGAAALAKFALYYVLAVKKEEEQNFATFCDLVDNITITENGGLINTSLDGVVDMVKEKNPNHPMLSPYNSIKILPIKTAGCIYSTLRVGLTSVFGSDLKKSFREKPSFDIEQFIKTKSVLFITADGADTYLNSFVNLIFEIIINKLLKCAELFPNNQLPIPIHLVMDDFATCGTKMASFPSLISRFRSKGVSSTIVLQSESQLRAIYKEYGASTIMDNCDQLIYLGGNDLSTAENIAKRMGLPVNNILCMPLGNVLVFRRGEEPLEDERYPIYEDKDFQRLTKIKKPLFKWN